MMFKRIFVKIKIQLCGKKFRKMMSHSPAFDKNKCFFHSGGSKGQTKSKLFFQAGVSSKKRTHEFNFTTMRLIFVRFLEEIEDTKKTFRN